jgi:thymidylate synthase (FAD)
VKVTFLDHMGSDLEVVNDARVSFGKVSEWGRNPSCPLCQEQAGHDCGYLKEGDAKLIQFLARGCTSGDWDDTLTRFKFASEFFTCDEDVSDALRVVRNMPTHWTPFGQQIVKLHIKAPIFVARQLFKHSVGSAGGDMTVENEMSRRYVSETPEFYFPANWREASSDRKQGSGGRHEYSGDFMLEASAVYCKALLVYQEMIERGIAPEQARMVLPQSTYTEWRTTGSLYYWAMLYRARSRSDAQKEVQDVARQIAAIIEPLFPVSWKALTT